VADTLANERNKAAAEGLDAPVVAARGGIRGVAPSWSAVVDLEKILKSFVAGRFLASVLASAPEQAGSRRPRVRSGGERDDDEHR